MDYRILNILLNPSKLEKDTQKTVIIIIKETDSSFKLEITTN